MTLPRIDAHQHFWQPARGDYDWMPRDVPVLNRAYAPDDLAPALAAHRIGGTVLVQAAATVHETEYMLGLADASPMIRGVVGWIDFEDPAHLSHLKRFARHPKFLGVRPMIQDISDDNWMLRADVQWAYGALTDLDLTFDALGFPQHIPNFRRLISKWPDLRVVFDHCLKPQISEAQQGRNSFSVWAAGITALAQETGGYCKLSGLVTEASEDVSIEDLRPFARHVLDSFGPGRVMWGSDWPVCRLRCEYGDWFDMAQALTAHLPAAGQAQIFGGTAARFYRLG